MTSNEKNADSNVGGDAEFDPPQPVALDHVISSQDHGDFEKPKPVGRDFIIKHGVPDDPNVERGA